MNGKLNTDNYHYHLNQLHRNDAMHDAENQNLAQLATEPKTHRSLFAELRGLFPRRTSVQSKNGHQIKTLRRLLHLTFAAIFMLAALLATAAPSHAQAQPNAHNDPGSNAAFHPELVPFQIGDYYQFRGDQQRAIAEFTKALEILPSYAYAYAARGDSYALIGEYQQAINDYSAAIAIYPDYVSALTTRGSVYTALGIYDLALDDFENAIAQMPTYAPAYRAAGDLHYLLSEKDEAINCYHTYIQYTTETPDAVVMERIDEIEALTEAGSL